MTIEEAGHMSIKPIFFERQSEGKLQDQLYHCLKKAILSGELSYGEPLPSIRKACTQFGMSRTPILIAYERLLHEGYVKSLEKSGFWVIYKAQDPTLWSDFEAAQKPTPIAQADPIKYQFDFSTEKMDQSLFQINAWRKCVRKALLAEDLLYSYGDPFGQLPLREALCHYLEELRAFKTTPQQVVIGAGIQNLLNNLIPTLPKGPIAFIGHPFKLAAQLFTHYDRPIVVCQTLNEQWFTQFSDIRGIYILPQSQGIGHGPLSINEIKQLHQWLQQNPKRYLIEDDFNGELRYRQSPLPAMSTYIKDRCFYIGSFSKTILPSLRIAYMALPHSHLLPYQTQTAVFNNNVSSVDQVALAEFIQQGHLARQIKKARKTYQAKSLAIEACLQSALPKPIEINLSETTLTYTLVYPLIEKPELKKIDKCQQKLSYLNNIQADLLAAHINLPIEIQNQPKPKLICRLCFGAIKSEEIQAGIQALKACLLPWIQSNSAFKSTT